MSTLPSVVSIHIIYTLFTSDEKFWLKILYLLFKTLQNFYLKNDTTTSITNVTIKVFEEFLSKHSKGFYIHKGCVILV